MIEYISIIINFLIALAGFFYLEKDMKDKEIEKKIYWGWIIALFVGFFFITWLGVLTVVLIYFLWSRHIRKFESNGQQDQS